MLPEAVDASRECGSIIDSLCSVVKEYLTEARGAPVDDFNPDTPFMDAGLDSLDMLKVIIIISDKKKFVKPSSGKAPLVSLCNLKVP